MGGELHGAWRFDITSCCGRCGWRLVNSDNSRPPEYSAIQTSFLPLYSCDLILTLRMFAGFHAFLCSGRDVLRAGLLKNILGQGSFIPIFSVHGDQNITFPDFSLILLGLVLRYPHADEGAGDSAQSRASGGPT